MKSKVERVYSEDQLSILSKQCQKMFRLEDWDIKVSLTHQNTMVGKRGTVIYNIVRHFAHITLVTPETYEQLSGEPHDMLRDLLHEYTHIVFAGCDEWYQKHSVEHQMFELAVERISIALTNVFDTTFVIEE